MAAQHRDLRPRLALGVVVLAALVMAACVSPASAQDEERHTLFVEAYFDGDTPLSDAEVRVFSGGRELGDRDDGVRTYPEGTAMVRLPDLPDRLRVVVSGGEARGKPVDGSLTVDLRGAADGDVVDVNPVTTLVEAWKDAGPDRNSERGRDVVERFLGIDRVLDDADLLATDRWFDGDEFASFAARSGGIGRAVRDLVERIDDRDRGRAFRPGDGEGSAPRAPVNVAGGADVVLDSLIELISTASGFTGPQGIVFGLALKGIKALITSNLPGGNDEIGEVKAALDAIAVQIAQLKAQIGEAVFQIQVEGTRKELVKIEQAQRDLDYALKLPHKTESEQRAVTAAVNEFVEDAKKLRGVALELHSSLTQTQPEGALALLPGVRRKIGNERFFTANSSRRIRAFFAHYEWWQTRLAELLSEYHTLDGAPDTALQRVREIRNDFLPVQRRALPTGNLSSQVFVDTKTKLMWGVAPLYRSAAQIPAYGFTECGGANVLGIDRCSLNATANFAGYSNWRLPTEEQAMGLFSDRGGADPVDWLAGAGVRFDGSPGFNPAQLEQRISLWLRDKFLVTKRGTLRPYKTIDARVLVLKPGRGWENDIKPPQTHSMGVAANCNNNNTSSCSGFNERGGGFFLWVRPTTPAELSQYW